MGKRLFVAILAVLMFCVAYAEEVAFQTNAPMIVNASEAFRVEFALNAKPDDRSFEAPSFEGFDVLAGPSVSHGSSVQIINGSMTKSYNYTISYVLQASSAGEHKIGVAKIGVDGKSYSTQVTPIEVRSGGDDSGAGDSPQSSQQQEQSLEQRAAGQIAKDDLMLRVNVSRSSVYKGEAVRATLKLYSRVNVIGSEGAKLPSFDGFWSQQLEAEQGPFRETLNGKVYDAYNLGEYILYPQQSGKLTIEPAKITIIAQMFVRNNRPRNSFFDNTHDIYNLRREVVSPAVTIDVKPFPAGAPQSFTGAVGKYTMEAHISLTEMAANSAANIDLKISGTGNIGFVQEPKITLPATFELYDVKSTEQIRTTAAGSSGFRRFEYPFIARAEGDYTIAPIEFTYFSPESRQYVTLTSESFAVTITPDKSSPASSPTVTTIVGKQDVRLLGSDIRFIKLTRPNLHAVVAPLVFSPLYFVIVVAMLLLSVVLYFVIGKRIRDSHNTALVKGRRANKVAVQRFRAAERYMREQNRHAFYEEMLRALWGYISDRFNIPVADLTKETIREELTRRGAVDQAKDIISIISLCEEAQYSPVESATMNEIYGRGIDIVSKIESVVKK
ncbi:MAG: protein BatD [Rikenellaceae bacterium]|nr:protein BatD [Rikenellaceae bacterium]